MPVLIDEPGPETREQTGGLDVLEALANRVGASVSAERLPHAVSLAYRRARQAGLHGDMVQRFRKGPGFPRFQQALQQALERTPMVAEVLVLGCGPGFVGQRSRYAKDVFVETITSACDVAIAMQDISRHKVDQLKRQRSRLADGGRYDLVISHSLLHYIPDFEPVLRAIGNALRPQGCYLMAHEPHARFWENAECVTAQREFFDVKQRPSGFRAWGQSLRSRWRGRQQVQNELHAGVNAQLQRWGVLSAPLTSDEIDRLVDPHRRPDPPTSCRFGQDGLDPAALIQHAVQGFELAWSQTYGHLGYLAPEQLHGEWKHRAAELQATYPHDGANITALFQNSLDG